MGCREMGSSKQDWIWAGDILVASMDWMGRLIRERVRAVF